MGADHTSAAATPTLSLNPTHPASKTQHRPLPPLQRGGPGGVGADHTSAAATPRYPP